MPTYDYKCDACGHWFEKFQPMTSAALRKCPQCGRLKLKRLVGIGAGLIFRGSGFYITDYRSEGYKSAAKAENGNSASSAEKAPATPGDTKPAVKAKSTAGSAAAK